MKQLGEMRAKGKQKVGSYLLKIEQDKREIFVSSAYIRAAVSRLTGRTLQQELHSCPHVTPVQGGGQKYRTRRLSKSFNFKMLPTKSTSTWHPSYGSDPGKAEVLRAK